MAKIFTDEFDFPIASSDLVELYDMEEEEEDYNYWVDFVYDGFD